MMTVLSCRWLVLAMAMMRFYIQKGTHKGLYRSIARTLKFLQTFALVEVRIRVERCLLSLAPHRKPRFPSEGNWNFWRSQGLN